MSQLPVPPLTPHEIRNLLHFTARHQPRPYINSFVRFHHGFTENERLIAALEAGWNVFQFPSEMLQGGDLLSDSGTTTLTLEQLSSMLLGDVAYGSNWGYFQLLEQLERTFGFSKDDCEVYLFHQGRAAEHALFSQLARFRPGAIIPNNGHFDTTRANIEASGLIALDLFSHELHDPAFHPFKGNMDMEQLDRLLETRGKEVAIVYCTITNNTGGGQPVSLENLRAIRQRCTDHRLPFFLDACRFAENCWFIQEREPGFRDKPITDIVQEIFALCDGFTISLKKDGLSNMGGALVLRRDGVLARRYPALPNNLRDHQILVEGHPTYGGLSGRDIMAIAEGLKTIVREEYLHHRVRQVQHFGTMLQERGVPVLEPFGGHAIYIDVDRFFADTALRREDFGGIALTGLLLLKGVRLCELGAFAFGKYDPASGQEVLAASHQNFVRCAIPRNKYEEQDLCYVADCIAELYQRRGQLPRAVPVWGRELTLRHFKARFELCHA
jgi:tryptophanase